MKETKSTSAISVRVPTDLLDELRRQGISPREFFEQQNNALQRSDIKKLKDSDLCAASNAKLSKWTSLTATNKREVARLETLKRLATTQEEALRNKWAIKLVPIEDSIKERNEWLDRLGKEINAIEGESESRETKKTDTFEAALVSLIPFINKDAPDETTLTNDLMSKAEHACGEIGWDMNRRNELIKRVKERVKTERVEK